jgi:hypothetical protein
VSKRGWLDDHGNRYEFAFLDYAFNEDIYISAGGSWADTTEWDGHDHYDGQDPYPGTNFGNLAQDNVMVIAAVFNAEWHQGLSSPGDSAARNEFGYSVQETIDGGFIIGGYTLSSMIADSGDVHLVKTDVNGDTVWTAAYGGPSPDSGFSVQQTADAGFIVAGRTSSYGAGETDVYVTRTDSIGDTLWTRVYGGASEDCGHSVRQTSDNGFVVAGHTNSFGAGAADVYLIKADSIGDTLWTRTYGGSDDDRGKEIRITGDGGYIVVGHTESFGAGNADVYLVRTDSTGDTLWTRAHGGADEDGGHSVQQTLDGGFIITGYTGSFGASDTNLYLIKTDSSGDTLWTKMFGGSGVDYGLSVQQTSDSGYVVVGWTNSFGAGGNDAYLVKTDTSGNTLWTRTYGGEGDEMGYSVHQTSDGGYIVAGYTDSFGAGLGDVYLIRTDANGDTLWTKAHGRKDPDEHPFDAYYVDETAAASFNGAPTQPSEPSPADNSTGVSASVQLSWTCSDYDPFDTLTYDVYLGTEVSPPLVASAESLPAYDPGMLEHGTTYFWRVVAFDNHGGSTGSGLPWKFTTNGLPYEPANPYPPDSATDVNVNADLSWSGGDPDLDDTASYDVYLGTAMPPPLVASGESDTTYDAGTMEGDTEYYWQIIARDNHGDSAVGVIWHFETEAPQWGCGDCNADGRITFADALYVKNYYFQTPPGSPAPIGEGDVNLDGRVTFADALYIKNYYFQTPQGSPAPCEPPAMTDPLKEMRD